MPVAEGDLRQIWSAAAIPSIYKNTAFFSRGNRRWEGEMQRNWEAKIPAPNITTTVTEYDLLANGNWKTPEATSLNLTPFKITEGAEYSNRINLVDSYYTNIDMMAETAIRQGYETGQYVDINTRDYLTTTMVGASGAVGPQNNRAAYGAGGTGAAQRFITATGGTPANADARTGSLAMVRDVFEDTFRWLVNNNLLFTGTVDYRPWIVTTPGLWFALRDYVHTTGNNIADADMMQVFREQRVGGAAGEAVAHISGLDVYVTANAQSDYEATGFDAAVNGKDAHVVLAGITPAFTVAMAENLAVQQLITKEVNQTGPYDIIRGIFGFGRLVVNTDWLRIALVREEL